MFYCNDCATENGYPQSIIRSIGPCEVCGKITDCSDMPSSRIPNPNLDKHIEIGLLMGGPPASGIPVNGGKYRIVDVPSDGKPKWYGGARCMAFVYSKHKGNFILKGFSHEVEIFLKANFTHYFYYLSMWSSGRTRGHWKFWKQRVYIFEPQRSRKHPELRRDKYVVHKSGEGGRYNDFFELKKVKEIKLEFKRLPKRWIPEFDTL